MEATLEAELLGELKFSFQRDPKRIVDPHQAENALHVLEKAEELTGIAHVIVYIFQSNLGAYCNIRDTEYSMPESDSNRILGRYDKKYFANLTARLQVG